MGRNAKKVDLLEGAPGFFGTPKDIILLYQHMIDVCKKNLGKFTENNTFITIPMINRLTVRKVQLLSNYRINTKDESIERINKQAAHHWDKLNSSKN